MKYFLAHNSIDVFHYGELIEGQVVTTGQPNLEYFNDLNELNDRLKSFSIFFEENSNITQSDSNLENNLEIGDI